MKRLSSIFLPRPIAIPFQALAQTTPPTVTFTTPSGIQRGATATFVVEGTGLEGAKTLVFSEPGLSGKVLEVSPVPTSMSALEPKVVRSSRPYFDDPPAVQARVEISAESWMAPGTHQFRIITPNGSSTAGRIVVSPYPETQEREPNDSFGEAQELALPMTVHGLLPKPGDTDAYRFQAKAGQEVVCLINAGGLGSRLDPVMEVVDASGKVIASNQQERDRTSLGVKIPRMESMQPASATISRAAPSGTSTGSQWDNCLCSKADIRWASKRVPHATSRSGATTWARRRQRRPSPLA